MKVLFVIPYFGLPGVLSDTLPGHLAMKGYDVEIVGYARDRQKVILSERAISKMRFNFVNAISISIPGFIKEFPYFLNLKDIIKQSKPDIIHVYNLPFLTSLQSVYEGKKMGIPSILHVHGVIGVHNKILDSVQYAFIRTLMQYAFRNTSFTICLTKSDAYEIQRLGCPYEKIRIIPNGVDIDKFRPSRKFENDLIFWGGRFIKQKGLEYLIHALRLVAEKRPSVRIIMTGDGPLFPKIKKMVHDFHLDKNVIFRGFVSREELANIMRSSSLCVLPSLKEGMPFMLLEAMASGKPVVGSNIPGINDIVTHGINGLLVPPRDPVALANAILTLLNNADLNQKMGQNARKLMVEKYSWNKIIKRIETIYYEAIKNV